MTTPQVPQFPGKALIWKALVNAWPHIENTLTALAVTTFLVLSPYVDGVTPDTDLHAMAHKMVFGLMVAYMKDGILWARNHK